MSAPKYMVFNGEVIPFADGKVHIATPAVKYGIGVFEGVRGYWNDTQRQLYVFRLREHMERLKQSMKLLRLEDKQTLEGLEDGVLRMIRANEFRSTIQMRVMAILDGIETARHGLGPVTVCIQGSPKEPHEFLESGLTAGTSSWMRPSDNSLPVRVKCNANYVNGRLAELEAKAGGFDRAILLNSRGKVSEGPGATMFIIRKGRPITPSTTNDILESITRDSLIALLKEELDLPTEQRDLDRSEVYAADEAFICGTLAEVSPIISLDGVPIGDGKVGPITRALQHKYLDVAYGRSNKHPEWRTAVYPAA
jgi:branched-chain amino acid aminotransferase